MFRKSDDRAVAIIPARLGSTRFPRKALADETGKPMVVHVCEQASRANSVSRVVVATDAEEIKSVVESHGFEAIMTDPAHTNGTSRLAEAAKGLKLKKHQIIVNVQGDEPEIEPEIIDASILALRAHTVIDRAAEIAPGNRERFQETGTVATPIYAAEDISNPNIVKLVIGLIEPDTQVAPALYFSRAPIPHDRDGVGQSVYYRHVGIYAYSVGSLMHYVELDASPLERTESLEQLRWLEHGYPIAVAIRESSHTGIDTPEQYRSFVERFRSANPG